MAHLTLPPARRGSTACLSLLCFAVACCVSLPSRGGEWGRFAERVAVVAPMLAEQPAAFGRPITDREAWGRLAKHEAFGDVVRQAEGVAKEPIPEQSDELFLDYSKTGNRTRWQRVAFRRRGRLEPLVLGECIENKGRFLPAIEATIRTICAERTWVYPAHDRSLRNFHGKLIDVDLGSSAVAWRFATADFLLGDRLKPDLRKLIRDRIERFVLVPYRDTALGKRKGNWWMKTTNNWNAVCLAGVTGTALALLPSREERAFYVAAAEEYSRSFLRGFTPDGYCSEGLGYWNYGFGHYVLLAEALSQASGGKLDLMARKEVRNAATFGARIEIANGVYPAFADCSVRARPSTLTMAFVNRRFRLGLSRWERDMATPGGYLFQSVMHSFPNSASQTPAAETPAVDVGLRSWFDKAGILLCRPAEGSACTLAAALKGGHNAEHHNHNDVGSYVAVLGSEAVLVDPGGEVYTARTFGSKRYVSKVLNSYGHPVPLVAGQLQQKGSRARASVLKTDFSAEADVLVLDIASAYKVKGLKKLVRTFRYSRKGAGTLTITDEVELAEPAAFGTAVVTFGRWKQLDPKSFLVYGFEEAAKVTVEAAGGEVELKAEEIKEDVSARKLPTRIGIDFTKPVTSGRIAVTVMPFEIAADRQGASLLRNGGFEHDAWGWDIPGGGMGSLSAERAASGKQSLRIVDTSRTDGSNISSARMPVTGRAFELRGKSYRVSGDGVALYIKFLDADRRLLNPTNHRGHIDSLLSTSGPVGQWAPFAARFTAPEGTAWLQLWIHSVTSVLTDTHLDDLEIVPTPLPPTEG